MKMKIWVLFIPSILNCLALPAAADSHVGVGEVAAETAIAPPNIIVILADDLGYGDLGSFGADYDTPRLDQLADNGVRFTQFYAASSICTQSRAGLLTGRYSARMGISGVFDHTSLEGMPLAEVTIAEQVKQAGYRTGMVGKWHLGHLDRYMPWNQGFDEFYGVPYSNDMKNFFFYENQQIIREPIDQRYLTRRYTEKALDYIERHADGPFFLYLAHSMPHVPLYVSPEFEGKSGKGLYADVVQELDWSTGEIIDQLRELNLLDNTLVIFTSDNGPWLVMGDHGGSAAPLRDGKITAFEGGQRVPTVIHWPAKIKTARTDDTVISMVDLLPTFSALVGVDVPDDRIIDGNNIASLLTTSGKYSHPRFFYMAPLSNTIAAYRDGDWKLKLPRSGYPRFLDPYFGFNMYGHDLLLFNLSEDPYEQHNIADQQPERVALLQQAITDMAVSIASENPRKLTMKATGADHKGYGTIVAKLAFASIVGLMLVIGVLLGIYRFIKARF